MKVSGRLKKKAVLWERISLRQAICCCDPWWYLKTSTEEDALKLKWRIQEELNRRSVSTGEVYLSTRAESSLISWEQNQAQIKPVSKTLQLLKALLGDCTTKQDTAGQNGPRAWASRLQKAFHIAWRERKEGSKRNRTKNGVLFIAVCIHCFLIAPLRWIQMSSFFILPWGIYAHGEYLLEPSLFQAEQSQLSNLLLTQEEHQAHSPPLCPFTGQQVHVFSLSLPVLCTQWLFARALTLIHCQGPRLQQHQVKIQLLKAYTGPIFLHQSRSDFCPHGLCNSSRLSHCKHPPTLIVANWKGMGWALQGNFLVRLEFPRSSELSSLARSLFRGKKKYKYAEISCSANKATKVACLPPGCSLISVDAEVRERMPMRASDGTGAFFQPSPLPAANIHHIFRNLKSPKAAPAPNWIEKLQRKGATTKKTYHSPHTSVSVQKSRKKTG